ncbi:autophagy-related protein 9 [Trichomonascus vanleenenianus]|uniref:autophagy protein ATG9 n=1 Tax=Trichomonascus vanleenenianus TaxID=2268995 RepID=UPI003EC9E886
MFSTNQSRLFGKQSIYQVLDDQVRDSGDEDEDHIHPQSNVPPPSIIVDSSAERRPILPLHRSTRSDGRKSRLHQLIDPRERALWKWANVENLDNFLCDVYLYYLGNGFYSIMLARALNMATILFVVSFATYLSACIDYGKLPTSSQLSDVKIPHCVSRVGVFPSFVLWIFGLLWVMKLFQYASDTRRLLELKNFYEHLLDISENDIQTVSWSYVVSRLVALKDQNLVTAWKSSRGKERLDSHDIANRIMRKENYLIAMINKNVLDLSIPGVPWLKNSSFFTRTLEWHLSLCVMDFAFNSQGQLRPVFLKESHRTLLADGLRRRFVFAGIMNIIFAPFIMLYLALLYFFRYFNEYHKDPSAIGMRQYTPLAEWKMREFNELDHLFRQRLNRSYEPATKYINQFPKVKTVAISRFLTFVAGSFAAVLGIISLIDPELFLGFEITKDRTVLFYLGVFGTAVAVGRGMIPDETLVFDPETSMREIIEYTHYMPSDWEGKLHSNDVKNEFVALFDYRIVVLLKELASVVIAPFILWFSLPKSSEKVIDFFREFSVHVDGLGYVCHFAVFDFAKKQPERPLRDRYYSTNDGKMLKSYLNFVEYYYGDNDKPAEANLKKSTVMQNSTPNLENSIMSRYNKLKSTDVRSRFSGGGGSLAASATHDSFETRMFPSHPSDESDSDGYPDKNGGVLGLLNEFYKQAGQENKI